MNKKKAAISLKILH